MKLNRMDVLEIVLMLTLMSVVAVMFFKLTTVH